MVEFRSPSKSTWGGSQRGRSFVMSGFNHYWGRSRKGRWVAKLKIAKDRFSRALLGTGQWWWELRVGNCPRPPGIRKEEAGGQSTTVGFAGRFFGS